jgi:hypothetical protein
VEEVRGQHGRGRARSKCRQAVSVCRGIFSAFRTHLIVNAPTRWPGFKPFAPDPMVAPAVVLSGDPVPLDYLVAWLTCTDADRLDMVMVGWAGAAQGLLRTDLPDTRPDRQGADDGIGGLA